MNLIENLPPLLTGNELIEELSIIPEFDKNIKNGNKSERLIALMDLYRLYIPSQMSIEIYNKLYLAILRSLQKKDTKNAIIQRYDNYNHNFNGIMGGSDSFTIIGTSGIGKSSAINRAINIITKNNIIKTITPYNTIIPCLCVQCPFDSSVKGLLLEILRMLDEKLNTKHYETASRTRGITTDMLIGQVSTLLLNHVGLLIVDEIQNVVNSKNGKNLVGSLTQLINNSGISICMVGTPESNRFFEQAMQLARRSVGLTYTSIPYDDYFISFCNVLLKCQYILNPINITDNIIKWLYDHSKGVIAIVIALVHDAQEIAILNGIEEININVLNEAYKRMSNLHDYINNPNYNKTTNIKKKVRIRSNNNEFNSNNDEISKLVEKSKKEGLDIVTLLKEICIVEEVSIC